MLEKSTTQMRAAKKIENSAINVVTAQGISTAADISAALNPAVGNSIQTFDTEPGRSTAREKSRNATLTHALVVKKDEFYTQYDDVAKEMHHYGERLRGKTILCNCDDPFESAFFRYFALNFNRIGLAKLISTRYAGSPISGGKYPLEDYGGAYAATVTTVPDELEARADRSPDFKALFALPGNSLVRLAGDGDFRSRECAALLEQADVIATNPPFSLFREFIGQLIKERKDFIILGNMNASTCKEVFPLFRDDRVWYGESIRSGDRKFYVPDYYPLNAANCGTDETGRRFIRVKGVRWFTNFDTNRRHEPLELSCRYTPAKYPRYENYNAIEVARTQDIPTDYQGLMGVPITFLDKYSPKQFEIVMLANGNARTNVSAATLQEVNYRPHTEDRGGVGIINGRRVYARILIRRKSS